MSVPVLNLLLFLPRVAARAASPASERMAGICLLLALGQMVLAPDCSDASSLRAAERPNVIVIVADDLGWNDVGWRSGRVQTPVLDELRRTGVELHQHYVSPMCSPTRAALLSGRYASRFGCTAAQNERVFPTGMPTLASRLQAVGYATALIGKWHLGSRPEWGPNQFGFQYSYGSLAGGCGPWDHSYKRGPYAATWHRNGELLEESGHVTDLLARDAVRWLEEQVAAHREAPRPFFLYVPFTAPHIPIREPSEWVEAYPDVQPESAREYAASVTHLDQAIGEIVAAVDREGCRENTLLLFFSDNGGTRARNDDPAYPPDDYAPGRSDGDNQPLRGHKTQLYEGGIRVPALANWPSRLTPTVCRQPLHVVDWAPTLCRLAGADDSLQPEWDGRDVFPALAGADPLPPRPMYWAGVRFREAAVRDGDWKLIRDADSGRNQLFDLRSDPNERHDQAADQPDRVARLVHLLEELAAQDLRE